MCKLGNYRKQRGHKKKIKNLSTYCCSLAGKMVFWSGQKYWKKKKSFGNERKM